MESVSYWSPSSHFLDVEIEAGQPVIFAINVNGLSGGASKSLSRQLISAAPA
jgi:hypothetical protein